MAEHKTPTPDIANKLHTVLANLAKGWSRDRSATEAHISNRTVQRWRKKDADFAERYAEAEERGTDDLEDKAHEFATEGFVEWERTVETVDKAGVVTKTTSVKRRVSERLLEFLLKARRPDKYRDNANAATPPGGGSIGETDARERLKRRLDTIARRADGPSQPTGEVVDFRRPDVAGGGEP